METGPDLVLAVFFIWTSIGVMLSVLLGRRGHDAVQWLIVGAVLGPLALALALAVDTVRSEGDALPDTLSGGAPAPTPDGATVLTEAVDVMVGYDGSADSEAAITAAIELLGDRLGRFELVTVIPYDGGLGPERDARARLQHRAETLGWLSPSATVLRGLPSQALAKSASERGFGVLAVGRTGADRAPIFGSTARQLSKETRVRVLLAGTGHKSAPAVTSRD